ncbi:hypothetical protein SAMN05192574_102126 [Mucilaginibacter gossypiicola]|uniref:Uncharacterized protein n=1 Tax=Mucilaginibacter gossypiicola TaxID=551995 RepID=A0A1H8CY18_9SPHI|nr:hypothetical protein SAMN05192574_102126 [Mucilaginibacter gossypiicola]
MSCHSTPAPYIGRFYRLADLLIAINDEYGAPQWFAGITLADAIPSWLVAKDQLKPETFRYSIKNGATRKADRCAGEIAHLSLMPNTECTIPMKGELNCYLASTLSPSYLYLLFAP